MWIFFSKKFLRNTCELFSAGKSLKIPADFMKTSNPQKMTP
jgi:hypothetical protein